MPNSSVPGFPWTASPAPGAYFIHPTGAQHYTQGASIFWLRYVNSQPSVWQVPAGPHVVEVVFPVGDAPPRHRFSVDIAPGETESLGVVDFSDAASTGP